MTMSKLADVNLTTTEWRRLRDTIPSYLALPVPVSRLTRAAIGLVLGRPVTVEEATTIVLILQATA